MQSRVFSSWVLSIGAAAAFSLAGGAAAETPSSPADKGAPARGALPADIFQPPPVPGFMLRRQDKPLTQEEMLRQAEEAAAKARQPSPSHGATTPDATGPAQLQEEK